MGSVGVGNSSNGLPLDWVEWDGGIDSDGNWTDTENSTREYMRNRIGQYADMLKQNGGFGKWDISEDEAKNGLEWEWSEGMTYDYEANNNMYPKVPAVGLARWQMGAWEKGYGSDREAFDKTYGISSFIDKANSMHLNTNNNLYRGVKATEDGVAQLRNAMINGDNISMNGPSSWSSMKGMAEQFTQTSLVNPKGEIKPVVFVDTTKGVRNSIPYPFSGQAEVLASGNTRYKITNIQEKEGITYVTVHQTKK